MPLKEIERWCGSVISSLIVPITNEINEKVFDDRLAFVDYRLSEVPSRSHSKGNTDGESSAEQGSFKRDMAGSCWGLRWMGSLVPDHVGLQRRIGHSRKGTSLETGTPARALYNEPANFKFMSVHVQIAEVLIISVTS